MEIGDRLGFINQEGQYVINPQFDRASPFSEGLAPVSIAGKYGYVNKEGQYKLLFGAVNHFSQGLAPVKIGEKWGYISRESLRK